MEKHVKARTPRRFMTVAFVVAIVLTVLSPVAVTAAGGAFTDDDNSIFEADIEWMADNGFTAGCNPPANDNYCPDDPVTRGQMAAFLTRALGLTAGAGDNLFTDDDGSIFEDDIDRIGTAGITVGCNPPDNDNYCPDDEITRGQMAAFLHRSLTGIDLQILAFNDYHGNVESSFGVRVDGELAGGGEYLSTKLTELRSGNTNTLTVAAGDLIGGSPAFSGLFHDEPSVESLNSMGLDISGVGNHEFDEGITELLRMQDGGCHPVDGCYFPSEPYPGADFQWLSANVVNDAGETPLPPYSIETIDGVQVGFIGMTLEATDTLVAAAGIVGWNFLDEAETANALVPVLKDLGVEAIIVLLHEGGSQTPPPGDVDACVGISGPIVAINDALDPEIDAIITGHTHLPYNCTLPDPDGVPRFVTSAYSFGRVVSEMNLVLSPFTGDVRRDLSTSVNHAVLLDELTPDPAITAVIDRWQPLFDLFGNDPIGSITTDINRGSTGGSEDRGVESPAGNLVADAQLWATETLFGADVAFMNPGGLRSDLVFVQSGAEGDGVVTYGEAFTFQPFGNTLVTYEMTGAEIVSVLEEQCQPADSSRPFLHLGVSDGFSYDLATTFDGGTGDCTSVTISNVMLNGSALVLGDAYDVTVNSFLADGGDNFDTLGTITTLRRGGENDLDALIGYFTAFSPVAPPGTDRVNELP